MEFGEYIRALRLRKEISLRTLSALLDIDPAHLSRIEAGKILPSESVISKLTSALDCNPDELLLLSGRITQEIKNFVRLDPQYATAVLKNVSTMSVAETSVSYGRMLLGERGKCVIEDGFPFEKISEIAAIESWRKEIHRPIYHIHKWWAQRLGSIFRAAVLASTAPEGSDLMELFYQPVRLPNTVVFDPFMGSGTTIGEALKLGCTAIGRDINPVSHFAVKTAMGKVDIDDIRKEYRKLESTIALDLLDLYRSSDSQNRTCDVLYYFWVKVLDCPGCGKAVDLFKSYSFARHAYPQRHPESKAICPNCGDVNKVHYNSTNAECDSCKFSYDPSTGNVKRTKAVCSECGGEFSIAKTARNAGHPPRHRMYAKLVLTADGKKEYLRISDEDVASYNMAERQLKSMKSTYPNARIPDGYNTRQVLNYGYTYWHEMFNSRQLLGLCMLGNAIRRIPDEDTRAAMICLFSSALEFNNMFASYKGEGTGAVRHMFSHHILKPERMPIEANIWGTPKSSGSFSTLFKSRLIKALEYRQAPFEIAIARRNQRKQSYKVYGLAKPIESEIFEEYPQRGLPSGSVYLSCGSSAETDLPSQSVDLVLTDPPFFDNVHYSELADFFYVWQRKMFFDKGLPPTTRNPEEVQNIDSKRFTGNLMKVFKECHRVLKEDGLLVFSYHHSREEGWSSIADAVIGSGFEFVQAQPVKSEMSVATPKRQAKDPIDLDILLVCRKRKADDRSYMSPLESLEQAELATSNKICRFNSQQRHLSKSDVFVVFYSQILVTLSPGRDRARLQEDLRFLESHIRKAVVRLHADRKLQDEVENTGQMTLFASR